MNSLLCVWLSKVFLLSWVYVIMFFMHHVMPSDLVFCVYEIKLTKAPFFSISNRANGMLKIQDWKIRYYNKYYNIIHFQLHNLTNLEICIKDWRLEFEYLLDKNIWYTVLFDTFSITFSLILRHNIIKTLELKKK